MYGKVFERMFTGSMMGRGALTFAVWSYVIAHQNPNGKDRTVFHVEMNVKIVAFLIGESEEDVGGMIKKFCEPDENSRMKVKDGRKLIKVGEFSYEVVNGAYYDRLMRDTERTEKNRVRQANHRAKIEEEETPEDQGIPTSLMSEQEKSDELQRAMTVKEWKLKNGTETADPDF